MEYMAMVKPFKKICQYIFPWDIPAALSKYWTIVEMGTIEPTHGYGQQKLQIILGAENCLFEIAAFLFKNL
jgi:hypothetical protein